MIDAIGNDAPSKPSLDRWLDACLEIRGNPAIPFKWSSNSTLSKIKLFPNSYGGALEIEPASLGG